MQYHFKIIIDTREQRPWILPAETCRGTLKTGDYAIAGDENFSIERKSLDDFLGTISNGWERFQKEIERMKFYPAKVIIVESDFSDCCYTKKPPQHNHFKLTPGFIASRIAELTVQNVSCLFGGNADQSAALAFHILKKRWKNVSQI